MSVLAVIPCLNEAAHLESLLRLFLQSDEIAAIVVADGGSSDGSQDIVQRLAADNPRLHLMDNPDRIQSAGVNRAIARFGPGHDWLLRIDAHCEYPVGYCETLLAAARANGADAVVVPMITVGKAGFQRAVAAAQNSILGTGGSPHRHAGAGRFVDHGHHALMRISLFTAVGGYCEAMPCNEDAELDHRQGLAGGKIWLAPDAAITYFPRSTPGALARQYRGYGTGRARTIRRHRIRPHLRQLVPLAVPPAAALALLAPIHWVFAMPVLLWLTACLFGGLVIGAKAGSGWPFASGIAIAIMHAAWAAGFIAEWLRGGETGGPKYGLARPVGD